MNELVDVHMFLVFMYVFPVYICCWCGGMYVFDVRLLY